MFAFLDWASYQGFLDAIHDAFVALFQWFWGLLSYLFLPLWNYLVGGLNAVAGKLSVLYSSLSVVAPYLKFVNAWFPLDVLFDLIAVYSAFWLCLVVYRTAKSWIPFVSG